MSANPTALHVSTHSGFYANAHTTAAIVACFGQQGLLIDFGCSSTDNTSPGSFDPPSAVTGSGGYVSTTYTSGSDTGPIAISGHLHGSLEGPRASCGVTVLRVNGGELWWFNGCEPQNYPVEITLAAVGATSGSYHWSMCSGTDHALLSIGRELGQEVTGPEGAVTLVSVGSSDAYHDTGIHLDWNGSPIVDYMTQVQMPASLAGGQPEDGPFIPLPPAGYSTEIPYTIVTQLGATLNKQVECNEQWSTDQIREWGKTHSPESNWVRRDATNGWSEDRDPTWLVDYIQRYDGTGTAIPTPVPPPADPSEVVDRWGQRLRAGSTLSGLGSLVHHHWLVRYTDRGRHLSQWDGDTLPSP